MAGRRGGGTPLQEANRDVPLDGDAFTLYQISLKKAFCPSRFIFVLQHVCNFNSPKNFTCLHRKFRKEFIGQIAKFTSPGGHWTWLPLHSDVVTSWHALGVCVLPLQEVRNLCYCFNCHININDSPSGHVHCQLTHNLRLTLARGTHGQNFTSG